MKDLDFWLAYAAFHAGDYQRASDVRNELFSSMQPKCSLLQEYENILKHDPRNGQVYINLACCYFMLGKYVEAEETAMKGPSSIRSLSLRLTRRSLQVRNRHYKLAFSSTSHINKAMRRN